MIGLKNSMCSKTSQSFWEMYMGDWLVKAIMIRLPIIIIITLLSFMPARCCIAPEIPTAMYSSYNHTQNMFVYNVQEMEL